MSFFSSIGNKNKILTPNNYLVLGFALIPFIMAFSQATEPAAVSPDASDTISIAPRAKAKTAPSFNDGTAGTSIITTVPPMPAVPPVPVAPARPLTKEEIAHEIAPSFDVNTNYGRLVQCYGRADYMSAFLRVRASRPNATPQLRQMAGQVVNLKAQMQPFVLASSTVKTEPVFRRDYDVVARNVASQISRAQNPEPILQTQLRFLNSCQADISRWRGGR